MVPGISDSLRELNLGLGDLHGKSLSRHRSLLRLSSQPWGLQGGPFIPLPPPPRSHREASQAPPGPGRIPVRLTLQLGPLFRFLPSCP